MGDAVLFENAGRVDGVFCCVVRFVFNLDGFSMEILLQGFGHGISFWPAAIGSATSYEDGFAGLLLQVGTVA